MASIADSFRNSLILELQAVIDRQVGSYCLGCQVFLSVDETPSTHPKAAFLFTFPFLIFLLSLARPSSIFYYLVSTEFVSTLLSFLRKKI